MGARNEDRRSPPPARPNSINCERSAAGSSQYRSPYRCETRLLRIPTWLLQVLKLKRLAASICSARHPIRTSLTTVGLCFRETGFCAAETAASKKPVTFNRSSAETKSPHENPPIRAYLHDKGKSLFLWDCVVGLGGLELPTKRLSAASSDHTDTFKVIAERFVPGIAPQSANRFSVSASIKKTRSRNSCKAKKFPPV
jgi:hypothetical protein